MSIIIQGYKKEKITESLDILRAVADDMEPHELHRIIILRQVSEIETILNNAGNIDYGS